MRDRHLVPLLGSPEKQSPAEQPWEDVLLERHTVPPGEIPEHEHPDLCLHLQLAGREDFEWWSAGKNAIARTQPGAMILIAAGTSDRLRWKGGSERVILSIDSRLRFGFSEDTLAQSIPEFKTDWSFRDPGMQRILREMADQAQRQWPLGGLYADLLALGLKTQLTQNHALHPVRSSALKGGLSLPRLKRAMEFMNAHLDDDMRLTTIATELGLSSSHFAHEFRNSTGQTPYQYLLEQRMAKARHLLRTTKLPVQLIAGVVGFSSPVNFVRSFRQRVGATPEAWRRRG